MLSSLKPTSRFSWADVVAFAYLEIKKLDISESDFLAMYCHAAVKDGKENPNLLNLRILAEEIHVRVRDELIEGLSSRLEVFEEIKTLVDEVQLLDYGDQTCNEATKYWSIILGIDLAYKDAFESISISRRGPLNKDTGSKDVGVYLQPIDSFIMRSYRREKIERIPENLLNSQLRSLSIVKLRSGRSIPRVHLINNYSEPTSESNPVLRIGLCLFSGAKLFDFDCSDLPLIPEIISGSAYGVGYAKDYGRIFGNIVYPSIDLAIEKQCDIIVFPEYVMYSGGQKTLSEYLSEKTETGNLSLIVAGSVYTEEGENVCELFQSDGQLVGRYSKFSPYTKPDNSRVERLARPGEECSIVDIKGIGRVLPSICKDLVSNDRYSLDMARDICPQLICAPAYSLSLERAFFHSLVDLSKKSVAAGFVCNYGGARQHEESDGEINASLVCVPQKLQKDVSRRPRKEAKANPSYVKCDSECRDSCIAAYEQGNPHACLKVIEIDYSASGIGEFWPTYNIDGTRAGLSAD